MDTTQSRVPTFAPLAFSLSIRSEEAASALARNAIDSMNAVFYPVVLAGAVAVAVAYGLDTFLPTWLSIPVAVLPGYLCFKFAKRYFDNEYPKERIQANRNVLVKVIDSEDAGRFADVVESIVKSQYGKQKWALKASELRRVTAADPYLFLATVFTFAPECWGESTRRVYDLHLNGVLPDRA